MSKERERLKKQLPERKRFYERCAHLAFASLDEIQRHNWLHEICEGEERIRLAMLHDFVIVVARKMAEVECNLKPGRGPRPKTLETAILRADAKVLGKTLPKTIMETGRTRNKETAGKEAAKQRSREYRVRKKNVT